MEATPDAVLVASKAKSDRVKDLVGLLRSRPHPKADAYRRTYRPWGWYQRLDIGECRMLVHENEAVYLPRLANPGKIPLELIKVQVGSYTAEDDIIRVEDVNGR